MGIYSDGKPKLLIIEVFKSLFKKLKEEDEWEKKLREGERKGINNNKSNK